jgi:tRNA pseudouridine13 synthase
VKLKRLPEDFQVEELTEFATTDAGEFALYKLSKRGLGTPEAIEAVVRRWKLDRRQLAFGGLKDRHAVTAQFLTIRRGPRRGLRQTNLELEYIGQAEQAFGPADIAGNRFEIVLRALSEASVAASIAAIDDIRRDGLPNYFDDQRFGSLGESGEFAARAWIAGDYERAVWLALADPNVLDRPRDREEKRLMRDCWGDWPACATRIRSPDRGNVATFLAGRPQDFRGAIARIRRDQRSLLVNAFQSFLWNRLLDSLLRQVCPAARLLRVPLKTGPVACFAALDEATRERLQSATLPLPSARVHLDPGPLRDLVDGSLAECGLALREIRIKYPRDSFFSKGDRPATFAAGGLAHVVADDELYRGAKKLTLRFDLPRGAYATIVIKRIAAATGAVPIEPADAEDAPAHEEIEAATI